MASKTHFLHTVLDSLTKHAALPLVKQLEATGTSQACKTITYGTFADDLHKAAAFWGRKLSSIGVSPCDVVGLWITGENYTDLVHLYALSRAGYVPQIFSQRFSAQGLAVIKDLLSVCNGRALVYDPSFETAVQDLGLPTLVTPALEVLGDLHTLPSLPDVAPTDTAMIFHTSGTTSGKPKPVPESHRWFRFQSEQWRGLCQASPFDGQDLFNNIGSFGHVGSATMMSHLSASGQCMVQLSRSGFDRQSFLDLIRLAGLNNMLLYAPWLSQLLTIARTDLEVLKELRAMRQIIYTGASLNPEDEAWIVEQGIPATVLYATTEIALCLVSDLHDLKRLPAMRLIPCNFQCEFIPAKSLSTTDLAGDAQYRAGGGQLYDFFIPASAANCPHPSLRNRPDGHISGDLFEEVQEGYYAFRGRNDDWIRTGPLQVFCDTKSIEDNCMLTCANLVRNCAVVGHYKPAPVLFVEPTLPLAGDTEIAAFKAEILTRTEPFNARLFSHERITDPRFIVVAPSGSLPRTTEKGNIRRKAVEDEYAAVLEEIYAQM
ncbi:acetyl-CoA synthetase-like protein [Mycena polygramma]|nr:acetyl-CoA synthetase-like protein [Mycena polygramma]